MWDLIWLCWQWVMALALLNKEILMQELTLSDCGEISGGIFFVPALIAFGKGVGYGIAAGSALYGVAFAAKSVS